MSGRGRGRGRAPPTGARLLLQKSAQEAGLDSSNLRNLQDLTKPSLYPDYEWHSSGKMGHEHPPSTAQRSASTAYLITTSRNLQYRFQNSPFFVRPTQEVDVVRYGKRPRPLEPDDFVLEHMGMAADSRYIPEELLPKRGLTQQLSMKELNEDAPKARTFEQLTQDHWDASQNAETLAEDGVEEEDIDDIHEEEEEVEDYNKNYYESEDDSDSGGGGEEATF